MPIDYDHIVNLSFPEREFSYSANDTILYALAVGMGRDMPADTGFVYERGLQALPTQAAVVAWEDTWQEATGMDISKIVHGEQRVTIHRPLAAAARVLSRFSIDSVFDKGAGRGAIVLARTELVDAASGEAIATLLSTVFARGDGGFGGPDGRGPQPHRIPERAPDFVEEVDIRPEQALLYRLTGDRNPLHVDPAFAGAAGFDRPILHGLCTWGMSAAAIVRTACGRRADRLRHFEGRFTAPVHPGDPLSIELWVDSGVVSFRTRVGQHGVVAIDHGRALVAELA